MLLQCKIIDCKLMTVPYSHLIGSTVTIYDLYAKDGKQYYTVKMMALNKVYEVLTIDTVLTEETNNLLHVMLHSKKQLLEIFNRNIGNRVTNNLSTNKKRELNFTLFSLLAGASSARELHDKWVDYMKELNWSFGVHNSDEERTNNHMLSFNELPSVVQAADELVFEHLKAISTVCFTVIKD